MEERHPFAAAGTNFGHSVNLTDAHPTDGIRWVLDHVEHNYRFKRGDRVTIVPGRYKGCTGVVDSAVFQRTVDYPDEYFPGPASAWTPGRG